MKLCPQCESRFPDTNQFCEIDGAQLVDDDSDGDSNMTAPRFERDPHSRDAHGVVEGAEFQRYRQPTGSKTWKILAALAVVSVVIGAVLFFVYQQMTGDANEVVNGESSNVSAEQPPTRLPTAQSVAFASVSPSPETSPSPTTTPSPTTNADAARAVLSSSPVSTSADEKSKGGTVVIRMTNGTSVEADEAWETGEGIWYRRSGVITLVEPGQVASIVRTPPAPSPTATPSPSTLP